jgi:hypothetical protein
MMAFCPVTVLDATNVLTWSATSSVVANLFSLFASLTAARRSGGKESPQSYEVDMVSRFPEIMIKLDEMKTTYS